MKLFRALLLVALLPLGLLDSLRVPLEAQQAAPATEPATGVKLDLAECVRVQKGELPIIISAPHGGNRAIPDVEPRTGEGLEKGPSGFFTGRDVGTEQLALAVAVEVKKKLGREPWFVISRVHRKYIDFNRPAEIGFEDPDARLVYEHYHGSLASACREVAEAHRCGLLIDIHGQGTSRSTVYRGTRNGRTTELLQQRFGGAAQTGEQSLFGLLAGRGWKVHPNPFDGKEQAGFTGGHIVGTYGSHQQTAIDAVQLEFGADYTGKEQRQKTAETLADALAAYAAKYLQSPPQAGQ
ncbi:MAG: hypothetical protein ACK56J_16215 [Planctomycetota bacterium]|jgi:N-formylglutamate amidohydrolase|nr:N-formylglutamate amidohydrolase [Blastopirellula sp.]